MNRLLIFFFLNVFASQAQKDSVRLADIQSSECGGDYYIKPHFLSNRMIGDTTYITLSCTNNCSGYYDPGVEIKGDSVLIQILGGTKYIEYKINDKLIPDDELKELGFESYRDSLVLKKVSFSRAMCDCCFTLDLKIVGLNAGSNYSYFYNNQFIDPNYIAPVPGKPFAFPYFLKQPKGEVCKKVRRIASKDKALLEYWDGFRVYLQIDTLNCSIEKVTTDLDQDKRFIERKLIGYFKSLGKIECITNPYNGKLITDYKLIFQYYPEKDELFVGCESSWPM